MLMSGHTFSAGFIAKIYVFFHICSPDPACSIPAFSNRAFSSHALSVPHFPVLHFQHLWCQLLRISYGRWLAMQWLSHLCIAVTEMSITVPSHCCVYLDGIDVKTSCAL